MDDEGKYWGTPHYHNTQLLQKEINNLMEKTAENVLKKLVESDNEGPEKGKKIAFTKYSTDYKEPVKEEVSNYDRGYQVGLNDGSAQSDMFKSELSLDDLEGKLRWILKSILLGNVTKESGIKKAFGLIARFIGDKKITAILDKLKYHA